MPAPKKLKNLVEKIVKGRWVKSWRERGSWIVQVWSGEKPEGDPVGDWEMPGVLGQDLAIEQAVLQTK